MTGYINKQPQFYLPNVIGLYLIERTLGQVHGYLKLFLYLGILYPTPFRIGMWPITIADLPNAHCTQEQDPITMNKTKVSDNMF